jgi:hypothetical protein
LDAAVTLLEGGDDMDLRDLDNMDYEAEEKAEEEYEMKEVNNSLCLRLAKLFFKAGMYSISMNYSHIFVTPFVNLQSGRLQVAM